MDCCFKPGSHLLVRANGEVQQTEEKCTLVYIYRVPYMKDGKKRILLDAEHISKVVGKSHVLAPADRRYNPTGILRKGEHSDRLKYIEHVKNLEASRKVAFRAMAAELEMTPCDGGLRASAVRKVLDTMADLRQWQKDSPDLHAKLSELTWDGQANVWGIYT